MPYVRRRRFSRRRRLSAIGGTRVIRSRSTKEYPKYVRGSAVSRKELHFLPAQATGAINLTFARDTAPLFHRLQTSGYLMPAAPTGAISCVFLNCVNTGTGQSNRVGDTIFMRSLLIRGYITLRSLLNSSVSEVASIGSMLSGEMLIVYDKDPDSTATVPPPLTDFLDLTGFWPSMMRLVGRDRFDVLYRKKVQLPVVQGSSNVTIRAGGVRYVDIKVPVLRSTTYRVNSTTPTVPGDIRHGALYLYCIGDWTNISADPIAFVGAIQLSFTDN